MKNPKILIFLTMIGRKSGGMSSALDLAESLYLLGYDLHIILTSSSPQLYRIKDKRKNSTIIPLSRIHPLPNIYKKFFDKNYSFNLLKLAIEKSKRNGHNFYFELLGNIFARNINKLSSFFNANNTCKILMESDIIIICSGFYTGAREVLSSLTDAKIILNHAGSVSSFEKWWLTEQHRPINYNIKLSEYVNHVNQFNYILFQAKDQAFECETQSNCLKGKTIVIKPSCDEPTVLAAKQLLSPFEKDIYNLVTIGSIYPLKGQHYAIEALAKIVKLETKVRLHFIGTIPNNEYYAKLLNLVSHHNLQDKVFFHGFRYDYLRYMAHADLVLQTSESEGVSRILRETMLLGIPIVSFAIPGTTDILTNQEDSILVQPFDIKKVAEAILFLLNNNDTYNKISQRSQKRYYLNHSKSNYYNNLISQINKITEESNEYQRTNY